MKLTIDALEKKLCAGCFGCANVCPTDAIQMLDNKEGFLVPVIDQKLCIQCGLCYEQCPVLNTDYANSKKPKVFAIRASSAVRKVSSSGGLFTVLALHVFRQGGIVCGAAYNDDMELEHIFVDNMKDLEALRGSKYVQSNIGLAYRQVKKYLEEDREVLFSGTPCQVAALKNYLGKEYKKLLTVDLLCHGVPSQMEFRKYLKDMFPDKKVVDVKFRDKQFGWSADHILVKFEDGSSYHGISKTDPYLRLFLRNLGLRESCGDCPFSEFPRQGDISIGDFWGITAIDKSQYDGKGTSLVYVNNARGKHVLDKIKKNLAIKEFSFEKTVIKNRIKRTYPLNPNRERFHNLLKNEGMTLDNAVKKALSDKFNIGIVSNYLAANFGGSLTQYALYHVLEDMGYSCAMIERPKNATVKASLKTLQNLYLEVPYKEKVMLEQKNTKEQMREYNRVCESFVVGSDQLFQNALYNDLGRFVTLDWVDNTKKKIAYAASYGHGHVWGEPEVLAEMSFFMKMFDAFSVREKSGVQISKEQFDVNAEWVLDPVFLCDIKHYRALAEKSKRELPDKFIASYILDPTRDRAVVLREAENRLGMKATIFSEFSHTDDYVKELKEFDVEHLKVEERLQLMMNCDFFVTDSFHGTCFAIIMKKPFVSIMNEKRGGSRFESLLSMFGLGNRLIRNVSELKDRTDLFEPIDFTKVHAILELERQRCLKWLQNALTKPKKNIYSSYDVLVDKVEAQRKELDELRSIVNRLLLLQDGALSAIRDIVPYLECLQKNKEKYITIVSVKDTPGISLSQEVSVEMKKLGFATDLVNKHWYSYVGVLDAGIVIYEELAQQALEYNGTLNGAAIQVISKAFKQGNLSLNKINGVDYSVNKRGLNFTVLDRESMQVIDSVCFDVHLKQYVCYRENDSL